MPIGVALEIDRVTAALPRGGPWSRSLAPWAGAGPWTELCAALRELRAELAGRGTPPAALALLPPLAEARVLRLPPLRPQELRRLLTRDASRYFPVGRGEHVADGEPLGRSGSPRPLLAAAAPAPLLEVVLAAFTEAGWKIESVVPAVAAWASAVGPAEGFLAIRSTGVVHILRFEQRRLAEVRRLPLSAGPAELGALLGIERAPVVHGEDDAARLAAAHAPRALGPELLPERVHAARAAAGRRRLWRAVAAAAALALASAGIELWGLRRELAALTAERARIAPAVATAMADREALGTLAERVQSLRSLAASAPRWSEVLADLAEALPDDASLLSFRGRGDSLGIEGVALHAAEVFTLLQSAPGIVGVRADAPIRQETAAGRPTVERFAVLAQLASETLNARGSRR